MKTTLIILLTLLTSQACTQLEEKFELMIRRDQTKFPQPLVEIVGNTLQRKERFPDKLIFEKTLNMEELNNIKTSVKKIHAPNLRLQWTNHNSGHGIDYRMNWVIDGIKSELVITDYWSDDFAAVMYAVNSALPDTLRLYYPEDILKKRHEKAEEDNMIEVRERPLK